VAKVAHLVMFSFRVQGRLLRVSFGSRRRGPGGYRGVVTSFSKASRKRMLDLFATIDISRCGRPIFVTLTYGQSWPSLSIAKVHLDTFLKRFRRRFPQCSAIWRMELQGRGAPHFHLIFFSLPFYSKRSLARAWGDVIGREYWDVSHDSPRCPFTRIERLQSALKGFAYLSKYLAKLEDDSCVGLTISHISPPPSSSGRWWGVFNRRFLPLYPLLHFKYVPICSFQWSSVAIPSLYNLGCSLSGGWLKEFSDYFLNDGSPPLGFSLYINDVDLYSVAYSVWFYLNGEGVNCPYWQCP